MTPIELYNIERFKRDVIKDINNLISCGYLISPAGLHCVIHMVETKQITRGSARIVLDELMSKNLEKLKQVLKDKGIL